MIALYIILGVAALITLILCLFVGLSVSFNSDELLAYLCIGPVKIKIAPSKEKKTEEKAILKEIKGKKISKTGKVENKKEEKSEKSGTVKNLINAVKEISNEPNTAKAILNAILDVSKDFEKSLYLTIKRLIINIDAKDAAKTAIYCGAISSLVSLLLEFCDNHSVLTISDERNIAVNPVFDLSGSTVDIFIKIKIRIFSLIKISIKQIISNLTKKEGKII